MLKTELFQAMQKWTHNEIIGIFANIFLRKHDEDHKKLMIEAISAVCCKEAINKALEAIGKQESIS